MKNPFQSRTKPRGPVFARIAVPRDADPAEKGYAFEQFIVSMFDHESYFTLLEWRSDKKLGKITPLSNCHPDLELEFEFKGIRQTFAIECKYQHFLPAGQFAWAKEKQLSNYRQFALNKNIPVFVVLGYGGNAGIPEELYCIPLAQLASIYIDAQFLAPFRHHNLLQRFFFNTVTNSLT